MAGPNTKPYTLTELEELKDFFRALPTFTTEGYTLATTENIEAWHRKIGLDPSPEQLRAYKGYWDRYYGGIVTMTEFIKTATSMHDTAALVRQRAEVMDRDKDGFISAEEFKDFLGICKIHDPRLAKTTFEEMLAAADTNGDGMVSVEEFGIWAGKVLS